MHQSALRAERRHPLRRAHNFEWCIRAPPHGYTTENAVEHLLDRRGFQRAQTERLKAMIILGIILLIAGFLLKMSILWTIGIILLIIGAVLAIMGRTGRAVGGRRHYY